MAGDHVAHHDPPPPLLERRHVWRQDTSRAAEPRAELSRAALRWALHAIVVQHLTIARVAEALAVSWDTANRAVLGEGRRVLINDPRRLDGVAVVGVDEHAWRHTRRGDKYVTVINASSRRPAGIAAVPATRSAASGARCAPATELHKIIATVSARVPGPAEQVITLGGPGTTTPSIRMSR